MIGLTLDAGALLAYEKGTQRARAIIVNALQNDRTLTIPTAVLAQVWRASGQYWLRQLQEVAVVEPLDEWLAQRVGELLGRTRQSDVVDAVVAVSAARRGDVVITSDPGDLQRFADDLGTIKVVSV